MQSAPRPSRTWKLLSLTTDRPMERENFLRRNLPGGSTSSCCRSIILAREPALRAGFQVATGDVVIIQDANLEYDLQEYPILLAPILDGRADVVFGPRFFSGRLHRIEPCVTVLSTRFRTFP